MDNKQYNQLYTENKSYVFNTLRRKGIDNNTAQDLTHNVLTKFLLNVDKLKSLDSDSIGKYLNVLTRNTFIDYTRKKKHSFSTSIDDYIIPHNPKQDDFLFKESLTKIFSKNEYELIDLYYLQKWTSKEISNSYNVPQRKVIYELTKVKKKLTNVLTSSR